MRFLWLRLFRIGGKLEGPNQIGRFGEAVAAQRLRKLGLRILCRNWQQGRYELDIVAWEGDCLVFVEVRTRHASAYVSGFHSLTRRKRRALRTSCQTYLKALPEKPKHYRFDVVEVRYWSRSDYRVNHYRNTRLFS